MLQVYANTLQLSCVVLQTQCEAKPGIYTRGDRLNDSLQTLSMQLVSVMLQAA